MNTKELKIQVPEGYEIDQENSTFECIKFKPIKKKLTYDDIAKELFESKETFWIGVGCDISSDKNGAKISYADADNGTSRKQVEKLLAINKLMNVAKYLNGKEKLDFTDTSTQKWAPRLCSNGNIECCWAGTTISSLVYFKTPELLKQAIEILGEDTIRLALSTDW